MYNITFELKLDDKKCLYLQIYEHIRDEIKEGKLLCGEKLPSTRSLAEYFNISRSTAIYAYDQLIAEGYIESIKTKGYFVNKIDELYNLEKAIDISIECAEPLFPCKIQFSPFGIDMEAFPYSIWKRLSKEVLTNENQNILVGGCAQGELGLRESICQYLYASRGVQCKPEQLIIGAGNDYLLMLLEKILGTKKKVGIEYPTYTRAYQIFKLANYDIISITLDESGLDVEKLEQEQADLAYIMPSHQYPTGIVMSAGRRNEILNWASKKEERYIIEDDYDSEFRYKGKPIPALLASDTKQKVIYIGTFSKAIAPAIRISYMVLPPKLLKEYQTQCAFLASTVSRIDQQIVEQFIKGGYFERYLNKMRKLYKSKHDYLLELLKPLEQDFVITGEQAGLHLLLADRHHRGEKFLINTALKVGVKVYGLYEGQPEQAMNDQVSSTILLGYGGLSKEVMKEGIEQLKKVWKIKR